MKFKIIFRYVTDTELPELIDHFANRRNKVTVSSEKNANRFKVVTTWREDLDQEADCFKRLDERLTRIPPP